jgi:hypothetical protein
MRGIGVVAAQVFVSVLVTGAVLPAIVVYAPGLSRSAAGPFLGFAVVAVVFVLLRLVWPKRGRES